MGLEQLPYLASPYALEASEQHLEAIVANQLRAAPELSSARVAADPAHGLAQAQHGASLAGTVLGEGAVRGERHESTKELTEQGRSSHELVDAGRPAARAHHARRGQ